MNSGVSIIICCYNSASLINETLLHLAKQTKQDNIEIILVDNNCTDATVETAKKTWTELNSPFHLQIIKEPRPGLNHARKAGVKAAKHDYCIFCDDDNWLSENYSARVVEIFSTRPEVGVVGGWSWGKYEVPPPVWFSKVKNAYAIDDDTNITAIYEASFVYGAGMAVRTSLIKKIFERELESIDRKGHELSSGGDYEICNRALAFGNRILKDDKLAFFHFVKKERLQWNYVLRLYKGFGKSKIPNPEVSKFRAVVSLVRKMVSALMSDGILLSVIMNREGDTRVLQYYFLKGMLARYI